MEFALGEASIAACKQGLVFDIRDTYSVIT